MFSLFSLHMYDFSCIMNSLDLGYVPDDSYPKSHLEDTCAFQLLQFKFLIMYCSLKSHRGL